MKKLIIFMFVFLMSFISINATLNDSQVYYFFDENSTGTIFHNGVTGTTGKIDGALDFDGTDDYIINNYNDITGDFTISLWFNGDVVSASQGILDIRHNTLGNDYIYLQTWTDGNFYANVDDGSGNDQLNGGSISAGTWYNIILTRDTSGNCILYKNNVQVASNSACNTGTISLDEIYIGKSKTGAHFNGKVDDVVTYNKILNSTEISNIYNTGIGERADEVANDFVFYMPMDSLYDLSGNSNHAQQINQGSIVDGKYKTGWDFDGTDDNLILTTPTLTTKTISFWVNPDSVSGYNYLFDSFNGVSAQRIILAVNSATGNFEVYDGSSWKNTGSSYSIGSWDLVTFVYNAGNLLFYKNGVNTYNVSVNNNPLETTPRLGSSHDGTSAFFNGQIDEFGLWNRVLSTTEVNDLYTATQNPYAPPEAPPEVPTLTIDNISLVNGTITNDTSLNVLIDLINTSTNGNVNTTLNLGNGTTYQIGTNILNLNSTINISEGIYNISTYSFNNETNVTSSTYVYTFDHTAPNISVIGPIVQDFEVDFSTVFNVTDALTGLASCTINATYLENVTNASQYDRFGNCTDTITFGAAGLYNGYLIATDNAGNVATYSINGTVETFVYVNFFDEVGAGITNYSATVYHPSGYIERVEDTSNPINVSPYFNGSLDLGNYTIQFDKLGYELFNVTVPINVTSGGETYNFTILYARIIINLYNDNTKTLITNESFSLQLSGPTGYVFESNGTLFNISSYVVAGTYTGLISSSNYESKEIFFTYTTQEIKELDVYFIPLNLTNLGFVIVEAYNADNTPAKYISTYAKQWFASEGIYKKVQETKTGGDGSAELKIILENYIYQFCIYTETGGETCTQDEIIKTTENGQVIPITEESKVITQTSYSQLLYFTENIEVQVSNVTGFRNLYVNFDWVDLTGFNLLMCYTIHKDYQYTKELVESDCVDGSAGTFEQIYLLNSSYEYIVSINSYIDGTATPMYYKVFKSAEASASLEGVLEDKGMGGLGLVLYTIVLMVIVALLKNPFHAVPVLFVGILGANVMFSNVIGPYALSALLTFCGMTAWGLRQIK